MHRLGGAAALAQRVKDHQGRPDGNGRVGHVKGGKIVVAPVRRNEVDHPAVQQPVDQVAKRPANDQREAAGEQPVGRPQPAQPATSSSADTTASTTNSQRCQPAASERKLKAAPVLKVQDDIEHRQQPHALEDGKVMHDPGLGQLVGHDHRGTQRQPAPATQGTGGYGSRGLHSYVLPLFAGTSTLLTQRPHSSGWSRIATHVRRAGASSVRTSLGARRHGDPHPGTAGVGRRHRTCQARSPPRARGRAR